MGIEEGRTPFSSIRFPDEVLKRKLAKDRGEDKCYLDDRFEYEPVLASMATYGDLEGALLLDEERKRREGRKISNEPMERAPFEKVIFSDEDTIVVDDKGEQTYYEAEDGRIAYEGEITRRVYCGDIEGAILLGAECKRRLDLKIANDPDWLERFPNCRVLKAGNQQKNYALSA